MHSLMILKCIFNKTFFSSKKLVDELKGKNIYSENYKRTRKKKYQQHN